MSIVGRKFGKKKNNLRVVIHFILTNSKFLKVELEGLIESSASIEAADKSKQGHLKIDLLRGLAASLELFNFEQISINGRATGETRYLG